MVNNRTPNGTIVANKKGLVIAGLVEDMTLDRSEVASWKVQYRLLMRHALPPSLQQAPAKGKHPVQEQASFDAEREQKLAGYKDAAYRLAVLLEAYAETDTDALAAPSALEVLPTGTVLAP